MKKKKYSPKYEKYTDEQRESFRLVLCKIQPYLNLKGIADSKMLSYQRLNLSISGIIQRTGVKYTKLDDLEIDMIRILIDDFKMKVDDVFKS